MKNLGIGLVISVCIIIAGCSDPLNEIEKNQACVECDLSGMDLSGMELGLVDLSNANLARANLSRANINGTNLAEADLTNANLSGATLSDLDLSSTTLTGANFSRSKLYDIYLSGQSEILIDGAEWVGLEVEGPTDSLEITDTPYLELKITGPVSKVVISDVKQMGVDIDSASIDSLVIKEIGQFELTSDSRTTIGNLELESIDDGRANLLEDLRVDRITKLTLRDISEEFIHARRELVIDNLVASNVTFRQCDKLEVRSGELADFEITGPNRFASSTCDKLRNFGKTRSEELLGDRDPGGLFAEAQAKYQNLQEINDNIRRYLLSVFSVPSPDSSPPSGLQIFSDLLQLRGDYRDLADLQDFTDPTSLSSLVRSGKYSGAKQNLSPKAGEWLDLLVADSHPKYQSDRFKEAFYDSKLSLCKKPKPEFLLRGEDLQTSSGIRELVEASQSLDKQESAMAEFEQCVRDAEARYYANLEPDKTALIELTVALNQQLQEENDARALAQEERRKERDRIRKERDAYEATYRKAVEGLYDLDTILAAAYIELMGANFAAGPAGAITSTERAAQRDALRQQTAAKMNRCLSRWFVRDSEGNNLKPNKDRDNKNLKLIELMSADLNKPREDRKSLAELESASGVDLPNTFFEDFRAFSWRCKLASVPGANMLDGTQGLYTGGR